MIGHPDEIRWIFEIQALKARYFRFVDTRNWDGLASVFTPDALLHFPENQDEPVHHSVATDWIRDSLEGSVSIHHGHMPEIDIVSEERATGIWAMEDEIYWPSDNPSGLGLEYLHGYGHYHEKYSRIDGKWLIDSFTLTRLWSRRIEPAGSVKLS